MYDDYMQNLMGFPNTYEELNYNPYGNFYQPSFGRQEWRNSMSVDEMENCYPEIYKIVYPMVRKRCMSNTMPITKGLIDNMVDEITSHIEQNNSIELNINLNNEVCQNRESTSKNEQENRSDDNESRQLRRNPFLSDIIRILILRELLGRPGFRPGQRPPFPPNRPGPRPPFLGPRPPMPRYDDGCQDGRLFTRLGYVI